MLFDPLEPRLLLSADVLSVNLAHGALAHQDHDLIVQMVNETVHVGTQSQTVQRVEVVDQAHHNAVLALGNLTTISQINIIGNSATTNDDTLTINAASFGGVAMPSVNFTGGGGTNTLAIQHAATAGSSAETWMLNRPNSGAATGVANVTFSNIQSLIGQAGDAFSLNSNYNSVALNQTAYDAGILTLNGATVQYAGLAPTLGTATNLVFDLPNGGDNATLSAGAAGTMQLTDQGETFTFADPTGNLTINLGSGANTLTLNSLDSAFAGALTINSGVGSNSVVIDGANFAPNTASISFNGAGASDSLTIEGATVAETWTLTGAGTGVATGGVTVAFSNVGNLVGADSEDTLIGPQTNTTWNVTGLDFGNVDGVNFSGFQNLQGADAYDATFVFAQGGNLLGGIDGGAENLGTLVVSGTYNSEEISATSGHAGSVTLDGNTFTYAGLAPIQNTGSAANAVFDITDLNGTETLAAGPTGELTLSGPDIETTTFADPTQSLTINLYGSGTLNIASLDPGFAAALTIELPDNNVQNASAGIGGTFFLDTDTVDINTNVNTNGGAISINTYTVNIANNVAINTQSSTGASGSFSIQGDLGSFEGPHTVTIGSGVVINTTGKGGAAGDITIATLDNDYRALELPIFYSDKTVGISVNGTSSAGVIIEGGNVSLTAEAEDISLPSEIPPGPRVSPVRSAPCSSSFPATSCRR